jgi:TatD DNase family protein
LPRVVIHCFSGSLEDALDYTSLGAYVSFAGPVTFRSRNAEALRQVAREIALNRVVIETDSPFLSPHPYRGKPNEPANVALVGKEIAELKAMAVKEVAAITTANAIRLFGAPSGAG